MTKHTGGTVDDRTDSTSSAQTSHASSTDCGTRASQLDFVLLFRYSVVDRVGLREDPKSRAASQTVQNETCTADQTGGSAGTNTLVDMSLAIEAYCRCVIIVNASDINEVTAADAQLIRQPAQEE